ncbi:NAD(+)/NADH kinase [Natrialbaceae archaeon A-arb3/5]
MEREGWFAGDDPVVGIVNRDESESVDDGFCDTVEDAVSSHEARCFRGDVTDLRTVDPQLVVARGEAALTAVARVQTSTPVLAVGPVSGIESVELDRLVRAFDSIFADEAEVVRRPLLTVEFESEDQSVTRPDESSDELWEPRALFDVTLVTDEPARISEYGVCSLDESVAQFRADGVVVATPAGTHGYASAVDAPQLSSAVEAVAVVPIAPFVTQTRQWVLPHDGVSLTVERDEGDVTVVVDGRAFGTISVGTRVRLSVESSLPMISIPDEN